MKCRAVILMVLVFCLVGGARVDGASGREGDHAPGGRAMGGHSGPPLPGVREGTAAGPAAALNVYLPLVGNARPTPPPPDCDVTPPDDPYRPDGYSLYFADEFDCGRLADWWTVQGRMSPASYAPPASGVVRVADGKLSIGVPGTDVSFPSLYLIDESATTYDAPYTSRRVDWMPETGSFRVAARVRFNIEQIGEHPISLYFDGHNPGWGGPLFYIGADNGARPEWRGLIVGADRGTSFMDLGDLGYTAPYTDWVVLTADSTEDMLKLSVDSHKALVRELSSFVDYPEAATRPDSLAIGSLALLESPAPWTDIELDWIRVYAAAGTPPPIPGILEATIEAAPTPVDPPSPYSPALPPGPFANTPYWSEEFDGTAMPAYWQLIRNPDPVHSWTAVAGGSAALLNDGMATGVPVWGVFDDMLPPDILAPTGAEDDGPAGYLRLRGGSPLAPDAVALAKYPRWDWRPNRGNVRYAWLGRQTANGYGVEISNAGHFPYFTGAMFYVLQDTTTRDGEGQFIFPGCQEQYFWRLHLLPGYELPHEEWTLVTADYINGVVHLYVDGQEVGWWPESDCNLNWYLKGQNATSPDVLFFGNPATAPGGAWSTVFVDWFATFAGL